MADFEKSNARVDGQDNVIPFRNPVTVNPVKQAPEVPLVTTSEALALKKAQADTRDALKQLTQMHIQIRSLQQQLNWYQEHNTDLQQANEALIVEKQLLAEELGMVKARMNNNHQEIKVFWTKTGFFAAKPPTLPSPDSNEVYTQRTPFDGQGKT